MNAEGIGSKALTVCSMVWEATSTWTVYPSLATQNEPSEEEGPLGCSHGVLSNQEGTGLTQSSWGRFSTSFCGDSPVKCEVVLESHHVTVKEHKSGVVSGQVEDFRFPVIGVEVILHSKRERFTSEY